MASPLTDSPRRNATGAFRNCGGSHALVSRSLNVLLLLLAGCDTPTAGTTPEQPGLPGALTADTWSTVQARIAANARAFSPTTPGTFTAHLPRQHTATVDLSGATLSRGESELHVALVGFGREDAWVNTDAVEPLMGTCAEGTPAEDGCVQRIEHPREGLTEWWVGRTHGLQQGWTIKQRPEGEGVLFLEVAFEGALVELDGEDASSVSADGEVWRDGSLAAWDATGTPVLSWPEADGDRAWIAVDDLDARYPITIDPITSASETKITASDSTSDAFGYSVSGAGDLDGDGHDDVIVGAINDADGGTYAGAAYVYYGTASGIDASSEDKITASDAASSNIFGYPVDGAGDLNGDGYDDVLIGALYDSSTASYGGSVYMYYGSTSGIDTSTEEESTASDIAASDAFSLSAAIIGDVGGDGIDDVVVGSPYDDDSGSSSGSVYVHSGEIAVDADGDGVAEASDCDDADSSVGAASTRYADTDTDGNAASSATVCPDVSGYVTWLASPRA